MRLKILTFFGAFGIARFMTGQKFAGWIRIFLLVAMFSAPRIFANILDFFTSAGMLGLLGMSAILLGLKALVVILWIWDIVRSDHLAYDYNFYQIMDLIQDIENGDEDE